MGNYGNEDDSFIKHPNDEINVSPSTPSGHSSDTLHENEGSEDERKNHDISPVTTLNFEDLRIHDSEQLYPHNRPGRLAGMSYERIKQDFTPVATYGNHARNFNRNNPRFAPSHSLLRGGSNSLDARTWISEDSSAVQAFLTVRNSMRRMFRNSDVAKWKVGDYITHREAVMASKMNLLAQQAQSRETDRGLYSLTISPEKQAMMRRCGLNGNFEQVGNFSRALNEKTIWCSDWQNGKDEIAPWPCLAEMKWEGDDRAKTGVGRYPPLPREQGPFGLPWNQLEVVGQYPLDEIARIPTMEDVYLPVDEIDDEVKYDLLNKDLEHAMDTYLES